MKKVIAALAVPVIMYLCVTAFLPAMMKYRSAPTANSQPAQVMAVQSTPTPAPADTSTPAPTATVGYQQTAEVAQATADEARRVNAQATAQYNALIFEQLQITAEHEIRVHEILSWTATAALTSVPLTATQQAVINTQIPEEQKLIYHGMTQTEHAPTQIAEFIRTRDRAKLGWMDYWSRFLVSIFAVGLLGVTVYLLKNNIEKPAVTNDAPPVIIMRKDNGAGYTSERHYRIPCTREQLNELSEMVANGERTFAINRIEQASRTLNRGTLNALHKWLKQNELADVTNVIENPNGVDREQIFLNSDGQMFFEGWFENRKLPDGYEIGIDEDENE